ncbi:DUF397 domain-containing protein [Lipingzhangella sp. LS1_29]|uniref:DUF397 domain-containing protein n=1 Tax=Lipingzhangella rawalii TaxID=2055835 RepID=A0ABU2HAE0_9ACTN|nr:DUF397 domain-containing protein [Lipingzhangella rawalii]MDS1271815.1 DUF397 domain-containing protein [Lipingzhangella rawalii]
MDGNWHKSSFSGANPNCLECRSNGRSVDVRDTQHRHLGKLTVSRAEWAAFLHAIRTHEL